MEEWTAAVSAGAITRVAGKHHHGSTTYFCGNVTVIRTAAGLVFIDTAKPDTASQTLALVRTWDNSPVHTVIYTHGHIDHTSGIKVIDQEVDARGISRPRIIAHRNVARRMDRYEASHGFNSIVQGSNSTCRATFTRSGSGDRTRSTTRPSRSRSAASRSISRMGEAKRTMPPSSGCPAPRSGERRLRDLGVPNAGNPRKVQRYAADWAVALRRMEALKPEVLIPGHGPVIFGESRAAQVLRDGAEALEHLTSETLQLLNAGATLDQILHSVKVPAGYLDKPYLLAKYDDPEFLVRGIYHLYAGWFDGNPAHLKPARDVDLAFELARLAGGADKLAARAASLSQKGQPRLAVCLAEFAGAAAPQDAHIQAVRAAVLKKCIDGETSLMGKAFLAVYQRDAEQRSKA